MDIPSKMEIVPVSCIPLGLNCPIDDLAKLYKLGVCLQSVCEKNNGIGLSAVQCGIPLNFFIIKFDQEYRFFLNCEYEGLGQEKEKSVEGCLSIKNLNGESRYFEVDRFVRIKVKGKELIFDSVLAIMDIEITPIGTLAIIFQHEIGHQNGELISDVGKEVFLWRK